MNVKIVYFSKTGHSKKIAEAVGEALSVDVLNIEDKPSLFAVDLLIIVGGIYNGLSAPEVLQFGEKLKPSMTQRAAIITSSAFRKDSQDRLSLTLKSNYIEVMGECIVRGSFAIISMGSPNRKDFDVAIQFTSDIIADIEGASPNASGSEA